IEDVVSSKLALLDIKNKAEVDLKAEQKKHKEFISKLEEMESEKIGVDFNLDDILKFKGLQRTKEDLTNQVGTIERNLDPIKDELKELKKDLKQWKELRSIADNDFKEKLVKNLLDFNVKELVITDKGKIHMGSELDGSGSGQVRVNLARFYSMISLINEKNVNNKIVKFPFIIDSPKSGEQSIPNSKLIFDLLINKVKMTNQIILATIDFKDFYEDDMDNLNLIEINTPEFQLMSHEDYLKNKQYIEDLLEVYFESFTSN
ncbi:Lamassu anti-phage system protein LmuB, partial [Peribacillus butanolivorans]